MAKWLWAKKEFKDVNLDDIMRNWDSCMKCGPHKIKSVSWYPPPHGFLKCNVDGVARSKPNLEGILAVSFGILKVNYC